jgi:DNA modification methylase
MKPELAYTTGAGRAFRGDSRDLLTSRRVRPGSVDLIVTSPPFALTRKKPYGNEGPDEFIDWFQTFVRPFERVLKDSGSLVIDIGGAYLPGRPARSTYHFEMAVMLGKHFDLCQEFYWFNPSKLPAPAQWVNVERVRVKDSVNLVLWFAKDASKAKADNRRVLRRYSDSMESLLKAGYQYKERPSGHDISANFSKRGKGAIPSNLLGPTDQEAGLTGNTFESNFPNLLSIANSASNDAYLRACKDADLKPHPARFPLGLPAFFIEFLTENRDLVLDPFAGSNVTGFAAETLGRRWLSCDLDKEEGGNGSYVLTSALRFPDAKLERSGDSKKSGEWRHKARFAEGEAA